MRDRENAWLRHQQQRFMRPDAGRFVRPDAARFLRPGTSPTEVYPALALKYNQGQPRVPAGRTGGGRWTRGGDGSGGGNLATPASDQPSDVADPLGNIDLGDSTNFDVGSELFEITPGESDDAGVQLAGEIPSGGIGHNEGPPLEEPPEIPQERPSLSSERTGYLRAAGAWIGRAMGLGVPVDIYMGAMNNIDWINEQSALVETYRDPLRTMEELQLAVSEPRPGTRVHHIMEQTAAEYWGLTRSEIDSPESRAHSDIEAL